MGKRLNIQDIEEFELVRRVPVSAVHTNEAVLAAVKRLSETEHVEPFLRAIIGDPTYTPHTSTEIADILTTRLTQRGRSRLAAFVNKGKATPRVRAKDVTTQLVRASRVPGVELLLLVAVGDIQDDAREHFLHIARTSDLDHLIVDATDVARLFIAYRKVCPKDGAAYLEGCCPACGALATAPLELTIKVLDEPWYEIVRTTDASDQRAHRYHAKVMTSLHYSKAQVRDVVARAVQEVIAGVETGQDDETPPEEVREVEAVRLVVYSDRRDAQMLNWRCAALWNRTGAPDDGFGLGIRGDERLGEIRIDWNEEYEETRDHGNAIRCATKQAWLSKMHDRIPQIDPIFTKAREAFGSYQQGQLHVFALHVCMTELESQLEDLRDQVRNDDLPPIECDECDWEFRCLISTLNDVVKPFAEMSPYQVEWVRVLSTRIGISRFEQDRESFMHEWAKLK